MNEGMEYFLELVEQSKVLRFRILGYACNLLEMESADFIAEQERIKLKGNIWQKGIMALALRIGEGDLEALKFLMDLGVELDLADLESGLEELNDEHFDIGSFEEN